MGISNQKQVIKMKHFKFILFFLICSPLIRAQDCVTGNCENGFGTIETTTTTYTGNFKEGRMHGKGEYVWKNGGNYKGDFREGFFEGIGVRTYKSGTVYKGHFKYDKPHGEGTMTYVNGSIFKGLWQFGYKHGQGLFKDNKGYSHEGTYKFGNSDGFGKQKWKKGDVYEGNFKNGYRDGYGVYKWPSNETYKGHWKKGKKHGKGFSKKNNKILNTGIWFDGKHKTNKTGCLGENEECVPSRICCKITTENNELYATKDNTYTVAKDKIPSFLNVYREAKKRYYYDENWNLSTKENSKYYREYSKLDTINKTYNLEAYYSVNNQLQWQGAIRNNNPSATNCGKAICEGNTRWYNKNGSLSSVSNYLEGREHGKSVIYLKSGKTIELNYDKGKIQKKSN